mmetsp:Transcript_3125/g.10581  ORF Transcript_3125/g.10581 Transcript_3125/m.10581 type:complete len:221 (+) Transcript_3125:602-1264(+)
MERPRQRRAWTDMAHARCAGRGAGGAAPAPCGRRLHRCANRRWIAGWTRPCAPVCVCSLGTRRPPLPYPFPLYPPDETLAKLGGHAVAWGVVCTRSTALAPGSPSREARGRAMVPLWARVYFQTQVPPEAHIYFRPRVPFQLAPFLARVDFRGRVDFPARVPLEPLPPGRGRMGRARVRTRETRPPGRRPLAVAVRPTIEAGGARWPWVMRRRPAARGWV